jgi:hypothetical protein
MHIHTHVHPIISQIFHPGCGSILIHSVKFSQKASPCGYLFVDSWYEAVCDPIIGGLMVNI